MSIITTFEHQCRALASTASPDENASRFLVGTQSPVIENLIYLFEYKDDNNNLAKVSYKFPYGEVWHLSTSNKYPNLMTCVYSQRGKLKASLFELPKEVENSIEDDYGLSESSIESIFNLELKDENKLTRQCLWHPDNGDQLLTCNNGCLEFWDLNEKQKFQEFSIGKVIEESSDPESLISRKLIATDLRWSSLFNCSVVAAAIGSKIYGIDTRIPDSSPSSICWLIEDSKCNRIHSIDFNPNSQYHLASGGDNCRANFWDLRKVAQPALHIKTHTHWLWSIRYNPFHDQLVLSSGSDARVALMRVASLASEPFGQLADDDDDDADDGGDDKLSRSDGCESDGSMVDGEKSIAKDRDGTPPDCTDCADETLDAPISKSLKTLDDKVLNIYEEHDDSVYSVEWATDPWIFASLGFESRLVINKVPKAEKFSILF